MSDDFVLSLLSANPDLQDHRVDWKREREEYPFSVNLKGGGGARQFTLITEEEFGNSAYDIRIGLSRRATTPF